MPRKLYVGKSNRIKLESSRGVTTTATQRVYRLRKVHNIKGNWNKAIIFYSIIVIYKLSSHFFDY